MKQTRISTRVLSNSCVQSFRLFLLLVFIFAAILETPGQDDKKQQALNLFLEAKALSEQNSTESLRAAALKVEDALKIFRETGDTSDEAYCLGWLGKVYSNLGEGQKALDYLGRYLALQKEAGNKSETALTLITIGSVYSKSGDNQKALDYYNRALGLRREVGDKAGEAYALNNIGYVYLLLGERQKAIEYCNQALALWKDLGDKASEAAALNNLGNAYQGLGDNQKALETFNEVLLLWRSVGDKAGEATTLNNLGRINYTAGKVEKALDLYNQALSLWTAVGSRDGEATTRNNIALLYDGLGELQKALENYEQALTLARATGNKYSEANILSNIGSVYHLLGEPQKALDYYSQSLELQQLAGDKDGEANTLTKIGGEYSQRGERQKAIEYYDRSLTLAGNIGSKSQEASALNNLGAVYRDLSEWQKAIEYYERALATRRLIGDKAGESSVLNNLGVVYNNLIDNQKALGYYDQALEIRQAIGDKAGEANTLNNIGAAYGDLSEHRTALGFYERALVLRRTVGDQLGEAATLNNIGTAYGYLHEEFKAIQNYSQALPLERNVGDTDGEAITLSNISYLLNQTGNNRFGIVFGKFSVNRYQKLRTGAQGLDKNTQQKFLKSIEYRYRMLADTLIGAKRYAEAQQVLNGFKDQQFFDFSRQSRQLAPLALTTHEVRFAAGLDEKLERVGRLKNQLSEARRKAVERDSAELKKLEADFQQASDDYWTYLKNASYDFNAAPTGDDKISSVADLTNMQAVLRRLSAETKQNTVAVYTLLGEDNFRALIVSPDEIKAVSFPIKADALNQKASQYWKLLQSDKYDPVPLSKELYDIIFAPVEAALPKDAETIMWSLDGNLRYIPMAALFDGKQYLVERYNNVNFTRTDPERMTRNVNPSWTALGLGSSEAHMVELADEKISFNALPGTTEELSKILKQPNRKSGIFTGELLEDAKFNKSSMLAALKQHRPLVHIASHFAFRPGDESRSFLLMGDGTAFTLDEMKKETDLFQGVDLLTLSACNTAAAQADANGREVDGFAELAQRLGAGAVMASLWSVADESTQALMGEFYRQHRQAHLSKAGALRAAQLELLVGKEKIVLSRARRSDLAGDTTGGAENFTPFTKDPNKPFAHPYYWSPFILIGNWK